MPPELINKILDVCTRKIEQKGENVGLSFYAFFANRNDNPPLLMQPRTGESWKTNSTILKRQSKSTKRYWLLASSDR
ncbi:DUF6500 family protein [Pseudomonas sp. NPDC098747]|uniref:DUF6500 family protein n=1 Tax=Pseudomonas sp. NPDC098747 TaxID=3364487 RepID=UPI00383A7E12